MAKEDKDLSLIRHPDFRCFYAIGAVGVWTPNDFRINFYSEKVAEQDGDALVNDVQVILPPRAVRELAVALTRSVKEYERTHKISLKDGSKQKDEELGVVMDTLPVAAAAGLDSKGVQEIKKDLKQELKKDLSKDIKQDLKKDLTKDIKQDLKKDLKQDLKKGLKQDLKRDIRTEVRGAIQDDKRKEKSDKAVRSKPAKIQQRGRRKVGRGRKAIKK
ncbi:MAG: hypothetical protein JSV49_02715 [Thermoplasmata archaeon]|nr:MAG: hypothetical protein JSV49_02715 [Thermoplasmata archaeon]